MKKQLSQFEIETSERCPEIEWVVDPYVWRNRIGPILRYGGVALMAYGLSRLVEGNPDGLETILTGAGFSVVGVMPKGVDYLNRIGKIDLSRESYLAGQQGPDPVE